MFGVTPKQKVEEERRLCREYIPEVDLYNHFKFPQQIISKSYYHWCNVLLSFRA